MKRAFSCEIPLAAFLAAVIVLCGGAGCMSQTRMPSYKRSQMEFVVAADTEQTARAKTGRSSLTEDEVQKEVERLLAMKPAAALPGKVVLYELPSSGKSEITSPRKWLQLRKGTSVEMKKTLESSRVFQETDFLPDLLIPSGEAIDLKTLRIAAARAHADGILIYSTEPGYEYKPNALCLLYPTIIGAFIAPGSKAASMCVSKAVLVDVHTGYIYSVMETYGEKATTRPYFFLNAESLEFDARTQAIADLAKAVAAKAAMLKSAPIK